MFYFDAEKQGKGTYATVWSVEQNDKGFVKGRITTSEKDSDDNYINSSWFVSFGKNISEKALTLKSGDRILMDKFSIKNPSKKKDDGTYVSYLNVNIYHYSMVTANSNSDAPASGSGFPKPTPPINDLKTKEVPKADDETSLPFDL